MSKIQILENKKLKLANVLVKELHGIKFEEIDNEVQKFINFLEIAQIQTKGPLITKNGGLKIHDNGDVSTNYEVMVQTAYEINLLQVGFSFYDSIVIENCLFTRFEGKNEELIYAQNKLNLHLWENDLIEVGNEYMIYLSDEGELLQVDIFRPVEI